jgi:hypothetical protein
MTMLPLVDQDSPQIFRGRPWDAGELQLGSKVLRGNEDRGTL